MKAFNEEITSRVSQNAKNEELKGTAQAFMRASTPSKYSYNFSWLGRPIIQYPQDIVAMQEIIWSVQPDLIIETGIAHGGSLILSASMLELNAACGGVQDAEVLGIDIDIRSHNLDAIKAHPMAKRISMIQGSSIAPDVIRQIKARVIGKNRILVCLDSNHTHQHVQAELEAYAPLVSVGSYCIVFDTIIDDLPSEMFPDRPWGPGDNPMTAVREFLKSHSEFEIDQKMHNKLLITVAPDGYLKRLR